jgi:pilus assembly protein CpaE
MSRTGADVTPTFVVVTENRELARTLAASGRVSVRQVVEELERLTAAVQQYRPDGLLVDLAPDPAAVLTQLERLPLPRPVLLLAGPDESALIRRAMQIGAREYLTPGADSKDELLAAVERLLRERHAPKTSSELAPLVAVMGSKGGVGTTFVACQLAAGLAHRGARVSIVDLNLRLGDVALYFDVRPQYTMASLAEAGSGLDGSFLQTVLTSHRTGVQVLAAPERPEEADAVSVDHTDRALGILRTECDWVVVDTPRDFDDRSVHVLDRASQIVVVTTCDVPALNHTRLQLSLLKRLGLSPHKIRVVVNRMDRNAPVQAREIAQFLERRYDLLVPNDYRNASTCVNEGRPLWEVAPKSPLCAALDNLTDASRKWCGAAPEEPAPQRGLRALIRRRRHGAA